MKNTKTKKFNFFITVKKMVNIVNKKEIEKCLEYVQEENKTEFLELIKELKVYRNFVKYERYFPEDTEERNIYKFTFRRYGKEKVDVLFGDSINNTYENKEPSLYDILTCVGSDLSLYMNSRNFEDFCSELGYDSDSIKALKTYNQLKKQYFNFMDKNILSEPEIFYLPN